MVSTSRTGPERQEKVAMPLGTRGRFQELAAQELGRLQSHTKAGTSCQVLMTCLNGELECCESPFTAKGITVRKLRDGRNKTYFAIAEFNSSLQLHFLFVCLWQQLNLMWLLVYSLLDSTISSRV